MFCAIILFWVQFCRFKSCAWILVLYNIIYFVSPLLEGILSLPSGFLLDNVLFLVLQEGLWLHDHFLYSVQKVRIFETLVKVVCLTNALVVRISGVGGVHLLLCLLGNLSSDATNFLVPDLPLFRQYFLVFSVNSFTWWMLKMSSLSKSFRSAS